MKWLKHIKSQIEARKTVRTISLNFQPANGNNGGIISVDIGKYYDYSFTRIVRIWVTSYYTDLTAASRRLEAPAFGFLREVTVMQLPAANVLVVAGGGVAVQAGAASFLSGFSNDYAGDVQLTRPLFEISVTGEKPNPGGFPPSFTFQFEITLQIEFGLPAL